MLSLYFEAEVILLSNGMRVFESFSDVKLFKEATVEFYRFELWKAEKFKRSD